MATAPAAAATAAVDVPQEPPLDPNIGVRSRRREPAPGPSPARAWCRLPGTAQLPDGRSIVASFVPDETPVSASATIVDPDASGIDGLRVRFERPGDRFHGLGAPGHKPLRRFLAEAGVPREERGLVPVVTVGEEIVWVAGIRPSETRKVTSRTTRRLRLSLEGARGA